MLSTRCNRAAGTVVVGRQGWGLAPRPVAARPVPARVWSEMAMMAEYGDVVAPPGTLIVATAVITIAVTAAIPIYLNRGQQAADRIFDGKNPVPMDQIKKKVAAKPGAKGGKAPPPPKRR